MWGGGGAVVRGGGGPVVIDDEDVGATVVAGVTPFSSVLAPALPWESVPWWW